MDTLTLIGNVATILTIIQFLTGGLICQKIYQIGSTHEFMAFPFQAGVVCTGLWLMYGLLLDDPTMKFVNTIGFALQSFYLLWFHVFTHNRRRLNTENFILLSFLSSVYLYGQYHPLEGVSWVGLLACISSLIFSASPLAAVSDVIRTRSTEKLPFSMILASFLVSMLWYTYGYMINDSYVYIPNSVNTLLSGLQLSLFLVFPSKVHAEISKQNLLEF